MENNVEKTPTNLKRFNLGAFVMPLVWALASKAIGLAFITFLIVVVGFFIGKFGGSIISTIPILLWRIFLGVKGNSLAWDTLLEDNPNADPIEFQCKQRKWNIAAICILAGIVIYIIIDSILN